MTLENYKALGMVSKKLSEYFSILYYATKFIPDDKSKTL